MGLAGLRDRAAARVAGWAWPLRALLVLALGAAVALGQVPFSLPVVALAALVAVFALAGSMGTGAGFLLGFGYAAVAMHWIVEPFLVEPERTGFLAPLGLFAMAAGFGLFWALPFGIAKRLRLGGLGLAVLWTGVEMLRSYALTGLPWALIGHVWTETPLAQLAAFVGVHGLTLGTLLAAAVMASPRLPAALRFGPPVLLAAGVVLLDPGPASELGTDRPLVRVVQPNVPQAEKWDPALSEAHTRRLIELSRGEAPAALVVWPETAPDALLEWAGPILAAGAEAGGGLLASGVARAEGEQYFNSLALADRSGAVLGLYDKAHLVPFGEYMPFRETLAAWGLRGLAEFQGMGFGAGPGAALMDIPGVGLARPLICYEGIFAEEIGRERADFLLLVTNDAWFGRFAGPQQHLAIGRLRAIEQGLPLVRSANTGISAVVDGRGRVLASLPLGEAGAFDVRLPPPRPPTVYSRWGDGPVAGALFLLALLSVRGRRQVRGIDPGARGA